MTDSPETRAWRRPPVPPPPTVPPETTQQRVAQQNPKAFKLLPRSVQVSAVEGIQIAEARARGTISILNTSTATLYVGDNISVTPSIVAGGQTGYPLPAGSTLMFEHGEYQGALYGIMASGFVGFADIRILELIDTGSAV